jgi:hypothetical protein
MFVSTILCVCVFVHTLDEQQTVVYNICRGCNCLPLISLNLYFGGGGRFIAHPITGFYHYNSHLISH